jgi:hypothetical protein
MKLCSGALVGRGLDHNFALVHENPLAPAQVG